MAAQVDVDAFRDVAREWTRLDFAAYAETFRHLGEHDASDLLPEIATPTLVVAGGRDPLTPAHLARRMADLLPDAEFALLPDATHFGLIEAPDVITEHAARFLEQRLGISPDGRYGPGSVGAGSESRGPSRAARSKATKGAPTPSPSRKRPSSW